MNKNMKKLISSVLCAAVVLTSVPWMEAKAETTYTDVTSRADVDVALRMGVVADSQYTAGAGTAKLDAALQLFNEIDKDYDGVAMVGDIVYQSGLTELKTGVYDLLDTSLRTYVKNGEEAKPYIFAMGNHEFPLNVSNSTNSALVTAAKTEYFNRYCDEETDTYDSATNEGPYINKVVNGYHFITAAPIDYSNQLSTTSEAWIIEQVDAAISEDSNKPVFVLLHQPIQNTVYASSTVRYSDDFKSQLQQRPQVVVLSGHTHYATNDSRMIWQDGFSVVMIGCTGGSINARYASYEEGNEATLLEVDDNNVVRFYRIDVNSQQYIGEPWVLDIPAMVEDAKDGAIDTNIWTYTDARATEAKAPAFPTTGKITVTALETNGASIEFPEASSEAGDENSIPVAYRVQVINQKTQLQVQDYKIPSDYYKTSAEQAATDKMITSVASLADDTDYIINVYAVSPFDKQSEPLTAEIRTKKAEVSDNAGAATDTRETITKYVSESTSASSDVSKYGDGDGTYGWMFGAGKYIQYTFDVPTDGKYELLTTAGVGAGGSVTVTVDGMKFDTYAIPTGNTDAKNKISAGVYPLAAGSHTIRFTSATGSSAIQMWSASLAKECDASVITLNASAYNNLYQGHTGELSGGGRIVLYVNAKAYVDFPVNIPVSGNYEVYVDSGTGGATTVWSATIDDKTTSHEFPKTGSYATYARQNLGSMELTAGAKTLRMKLTSNSASVSIRRVILVKEGFSYAITQEAKDCTELVGVNKAPSSGEGWSALFNQGYISFTVTPEYSGVYDFSWLFAASGMEGKTYINGELIDTRTYKGGSLSTKNGAVSQSIGNVILDAGKTYVIKIHDDGTSTFGITRLVLTYLREVTIEDGITIHAYAGDNVATNIPSNIQYGDGKGDAGFSFSGNQYIEFDVKITQDGLYKVALQLGNAEESGVASISVYVGDKLVQVKNAANSGHFNTKLMNDWGEVVLQKGTHRFKVESHSGGVHFFKLQLTSVRKISDTDPYYVSIPATSYAEGTLTGDSKVEGSSVVIANDASYVQYNVDVPAGNYALSIRYSRNANSKLGLIVNGEAVGSYTLTPSSPYITKMLGVISLNEGVNTIRIKRSSSYFYFTSIRLEKIAEPVSELYSGDYIVTGNNMAEEFVGVSGNMVVRTYLPATMKDSYVQLIAGIYEGDTLVESVFSKPVMASVNSVVVTRFENVALDETKTYTWKVQDYVQYTLSHAGISDGADAVSGTFGNGTQNAYDKVAFASRLIFNQQSATMKYAMSDDSAIEISLNEDGALVVNGLAEEILITPNQFGFTSFEGQAFELQITTDVEAEQTMVGFWIDKELANHVLYEKTDATMGSGVTFDDGITRYSLWRIAKPSNEGVSFVEMQKGIPYIVKDDSFVDVDNNSYAIGTEIKIAGEYVATTGVQTRTLVLWKKYDLHADGTCNVKDLVAMKKFVENTENLPTEKSAQMAVSQLESAYELVSMRQELVDTED